MFCETCIGVLQHRRHLINCQTQTYRQSGDSEKKSYVAVTCGHHSTYKSLIAAAANGCPICRPTWDNLPRPLQDSLRAFGSKDNVKTTTSVPSIRFITSTQLESWGHWENVHLTVCYNRGNFRELQIMFSKFILDVEDGLSFSHNSNTGIIHETTSKSVQNVHTDGGFTTDHTSSTASLQMAATWLGDCTKSHPQCKPYSDGPWHPTRLLDLVEHRGNEGYVRLIRTAEISPNGPYASLSHRWGNYKPLQLTQSMASNPRYQFPVATLPKTFQEAIHVCRRLGIQYLWIDSLCIIQEGDNLHDWYHEAGLMDKVYMHSYLNIYAADATDSTKGLFRYRLPLSLGRQRVLVDLKGIKSDSGLTNCLMTDCLLWPRNLRNSSLNKRGWVLQERYLAPRVLHFCQNQIFWECNKHVVCETFPHGGMAQYTQGIKSWNNQFALCGPSQNELISFWNAVIIPLYTQMDLSISSDKLVALSGIAKHFMVRLEDTYVAGMWRSQLEDSLLWSLTHTSSRPRPLVYRSPSWSWASVDGAIQTLRLPTEEKSIIHVVDVVLHHTTEDTTGAITGGWLDLCGVLKPTRLFEVRESGTPPHIVLGRAAIFPEPDIMDEYAPVMTGVQLDFLPDDDYFWHHETVRGRLFYMPCQSEGGQVNRIICLLLRLVDQEKTLFERIGLFSTYEEEEKQQLMEDLDEDTRARLPCLRYENGLHTIRII